MNPPVKPHPPLSLEDINHCEPNVVANRLSDVYPVSWVVERALTQRPFETLNAFKLAMVTVVNRASSEEQMALIQAAPDVVTACESWLDSGTSVQTLAEAAKSYAARFGFGFLLDVAGPRGTGFAFKEIIDTIQRRSQNPVDFEAREALRQIHRMAEHRLHQCFATTPDQGNQLWDWCEELAQYSEPLYAERGELAVTYLTDAHRACATYIARLMREQCGFDEVQIDAVGNVVGVYHGQDPKSRRLLTGSHYDTVCNGGKYDGRLGVFAPMLCVQALARESKRLPFGIEVVAFAEEEGQRYKAVFLGSGALTGEFDRAWLDLTDSDGVTMREAMLNAGLDVDGIEALKRDPEQYLGFVEVHIEQGPVLAELDLPLGVVTSINGSARFMGEITGMASHAGTTPMGMRRDAAVAVAELALYVEQRASAVPNLVATIGMMEVPSGSVNVVPGRCRFSLDVRATTDDVRDACVADIKVELARICQRRGLRFDLEEFMRASAAPSSPVWQSRWEQSVKSLGLPVYHMPSGAGHDAMKLHNVMPQAMLFVRGFNSGISHNPLEMTTNDDAQACVDAFGQLLGQLAQAGSDQ